MKYSNLGNNGEKSSVIGLGCMSMSHAYSGRDDKESVAKVLG
jgi:predicted aldo/keto reductase-like oxidoreductase